MKVKVTWFTLALALALILSPLLVAGANATTAAEKPIVDSADVALEWHEPTMNWTLFWETFKQHSVWDLEYRNGTLWSSVKHDLQVTRQYLEDKHCKITLNFTASHTADYRLTFGIDYRVKNYTAKLDKWQYQVVYENMTVTFDWFDVAVLPNLVITHGVKNDYFWFRIRKDNVQQGRNVVIDPNIVLDSFDNVFGNSYLIMDVHPSDSAGESAQAQSFKFTTGADKYYLKSCSFTLEKFGLPTGHLRADLYEHAGTFGSGGKATGEPLASSGLVELPTTKAWVNFTFSSSYYKLEKNIAYVIAVVLNDGVVDGSNYVKVWGDAGDDGNRCEFINGVWGATSNDVGFYVYGEDAGASAGGSTVSVQLPNVLWYVKEIGRRILDFLSQRHVKIVLGVAAFMGIGLIVLKHEKGKKHG